MKPQTAHPYIEKRRGHRGGRAIIAGTNLPVSSVANYIINQGMLPEQPMIQIKLYLDEDVNPLLAKDLRRRGYDALATGEAGNLNLSGRDQPDYARGQGRALLTHNRDDFLDLANEYAINPIPHCGILRVPQVPYGQLLRRVLRFLAVVTEAQVRDVFIWIP
jgi:predicted nuclease of predicted toxin-antitoxin system